MKVLVLKDNNDDSFEIIVSDGGYAFCYENDECISVDYYQGRITEPISEERPAYDICLENSYKTYFKKYPFGTSNQLILAETYNWLTMGNIKEAEEIIYKNIRKHAEHHINDFLFQDGK